VVALPLALVALAAPPRSAAQDDDWGLTRERAAPSRPRTTGPRRAPRATTERPAAETGDRDALLAERYLRVLDAEPSDGFALDRLIELERARAGSTDALVARYRARIESEREPYAPRMIVGHLLRRGGRLDDARAEYEAASALRPREALPHVALARLALERGDRDAARAALERASTLAAPGTTRDEVRRQLAALALDRNDLDDARRHYDELARGAGGSLFLRTELARALAERGRHDQAIEEYTRIARAASGDHRALAPVLLELGRAQLAAGHTEDAIASIERAISAGGPSSGARGEAEELRIDAYRRADRLEELATRLARGGAGFESASVVGRVHDELGHDDLALAAYRRALRARPRDVDTRLRMIQVLGRAGRLDELAAEYRALIRSAPGEPRYVVQLADLLVQLGRRPDAMQMLAEVSRSSREPAMHQRLAELYARWEEPARAEAELDRLVALEPGDPVHLVALGAQRFAQGERDAALATWRRILTIGERAPAHAALGAILADHDLLTEAVEQYEESVRLAPGSLDALRGLASVLERAGREDDAEQRWREVLASAGEDRAARREARERLVGLWSRARRVERRIPELTRALEATPPDLESGHLLAELQRRRRDLEGAERTLARLDQLAPGDVEILTSLERVRTQRGDLAGAITVLRQLTTADPRRASQYLERMAAHAIALYRDEEALGYAREAVERNPDDAGAHRRLGDLMRARQDATGAIASYRHALALDDRLFETAFELAEMHLARGEDGEADRVYRGVLARAPDDDLVARAARASMQIHVGAGTLEELEREILPLALAHPDRPVFRRIAVEIYDAIATPLAVRARRSGEEGIAARAALRRYATRALKPLLEALADDGDRAQRRIALSILGALASPAASPTLIAFAENASREADERVLAVLAAAEAPRAELAPRLAALSRDGDPRVRSAALAALARATGAPALAALRAALDDEEPRVRAHAVLGVGALGDRVSSARLRALLAEPHAEVRSAAAIALAWIGDAESIPALIALAGEADTSAAELALAALGAFGALPARRALIAALFGAEPRARDIAVIALRRGIVRPRALAVPRAGEGPRELALRVLRSEEPLPPIDLGPLVPLAVEAVHEAIASGPPARARGALAALASGVRPVALGELTRDLPSWPEAAQRAAYAELARLSAALRGDLAIAATLVDASVRAEAIRVIAHAGEDGAEAILATALADDAALVRRAALDALGEGAPASQDAIVAASAILRSHRDWGMRTRAARALGAIGGERVVPELEEALSADAFAFVREAAAIALGGIGGARAEAALRRASTDDVELRVRHAAEVALAGAPGR
jgi:tetratricopeptide (TPR) repeat protein/HEAT repeat protein